MESQGRNHDDWMIAVGLIAITLFVVLAVVLLVVVLPGQNINLLGIGLPDHTLKAKVAGGNVSDSVVAQTIDILQERFDFYSYEVQIEPLRENGDVFLLIGYDDVPDDDVRYLVATQGLFTMQVQGQDPGDPLVVNNNDLADPCGRLWTDISGGEKSYSVMINLTADGAARFRDACLTYGAADASKYNLIVMRLDGESIYEAPLSHSLLTTLQSGPVNLMMAGTGTGDEGHAEARRISAILQSGMLPARLEIVPT